MKLNKCYLCEELKTTPYHSTEIQKDKSVVELHICADCGKAYVESLLGNKGNFYITTPEQLLEYLTETKPLPPCKCGLTEQELDKTGRFGCANCYDHFKDKVEIIISYCQKSDQHTGSKPSFLHTKDSKNPVEKLKLLKLQYAKALELEEYEKLKDLKFQIDKINNQ
jgi:protein arginine kinase activator